MTRRSESQFGTNSSPVPSPSRRARFGWVRTPCESAPERPSASGFLAGRGEAPSSHLSRAPEVGSVYGLLSAPRYAFRCLCACKVALCRQLLVYGESRRAVCREFQAKLVNLSEGLLPNESPTMLAPTRIGTSQATSGSGCFSLLRQQPELRRLLLLLLLRLRLRSFASCSCSSLVSRSAKASKWTPRWGYLHRGR